MHRKKETIEVYTTSDYKHDVYTVLFGLKSGQIFTAALTGEWIRNQKVAKKLLGKKLSKILSQNLCQEAMVHCKIIKDQYLGFY